MADLEERALKRDGRFLWRLLIVLALGTLGGLFMFAQLTGERAIGCAARSVGGVTEAPPSE